MKQKQYTTAKKTRDQIEKTMDLLRNQQLKTKTKEKIQKLYRVSKQIDQPYQTTINLSKHYFDNHAFYFLL
jgi:hypothetical protein